MAVTGASGAPYAVRLLEQLVRAGRDVSLIVSAHGWRLLRLEAGIQDVSALAVRVGAQGWERHVTVYDDGDRGAAPASGSARTSGMVICPCSMGTLSAISAGTSRSLNERAADVTLKERRPLLLVPRETPLNLIQIENLRRAAEGGAVIVPAMPAFYFRPRTLEDVADFIAGRLLALLGVQHTLFTPWEG
jgi:4-hydroxy-3-polyprenylbenzoate decarboxylase